jgi:hypothetical protein
MTKQEIAELIEHYGEHIPEKATGNEANPMIADRLSGVVRTDRNALIEVLRDWIGARVPQSRRKSEDALIESNLWLALELVEQYALAELLPDINALIADVRAGSTYLPYYVDTIESYLRGVRHQQPINQHPDDAR